MNTLEASTYYAEQYGEGIDIVYGIVKFTYAGHYLTIDLLTAEDDEETSFNVRSTGSHPIEGGTYPAHFAEAEASELISDNFTGKGGDWQTLRAEIRDTVRTLKNTGEFGDN